MGSLKRDCEEYGDNVGKYGFCIMAESLEEKDIFVEKLKSMPYIDSENLIFGKPFYVEHRKKTFYSISGYATGHLKSQSLQYSVQLKTKPSEPGCWDVMDVEVFKNGEKVGQYGRNYCSFGKSTFAPFVYKGKEYVLYSPDYTSTRVMTLPDCKDFCGEERDAYGFCPVEYYVPINPFTGECPGFAFLAGCVWGDDTSWKIQFLDLSKVDKGIIKRDDRFGYIELPGGMRLKDAIDVGWDENPNSFKNSNYVEIITKRDFKLDTGKDVMEDYK